mgnify:CR=1 FL=1
MKKILIYAVLFGCAGMAGCNDFLDKVPDNRTTIDSKDKVAALLVSAYPTSTYMTLLEPRCDQYVDLGVTMDGSQPLPAMDNIVSGFMWDEYTRTESGNDTYEQYWTACYAAIAAANHALEAIDRLPDPAAAVQERGEALIARSFNHFCLLSMYSDLFDRTNEAVNPGIPYVDQPEDIVIREYDRGTVGSTLERIRTDLAAGMKLVGGAGNYKQPKYHFTPASANAFGARLALFTEDYPSVIRYVNAVLPVPSAFFHLKYTDGTPVTNEDGTPVSGVDPEDVANVYMQNNLHNWAAYVKTGNPDAMAMAFSGADAEANLLVSECATTIWRSTVGTYFVRHAIGLTEFRSLITDNPTGASWVFPKVAFQWNGDPTVWLPKFYEDFKMENVAAQTGVAYAKIPLLRMEEMLLNRAEAYAMTGQYDKALADLNMYAACRMDEYKYGPHTLYKDKIVNYYILQLRDKNHFINSPYNARKFKSGDEGLFQKALILTILDFRHTEFIYEGMRYFDILRWYIPVTHRTTDGGVSTLTPDDDRRIIQLPQITRISGLEPNEMSNIPYPW